jgi:2-C-methyl-D-erythritol 2,4-cyclodiphosphate synthase
MSRMGTGFDAHAFTEGRSLILGGVEIEHDRGLAGHSDADVLCHAVMDALLGAVAAGDIGLHFPDTDPEWKNARSLDLLSRIGSVVSEKGFKIINVDSTVIGERPKISALFDEMRSNIAEALDLSIEDVSVKATTTEGMGALGRGEGLAAMAVATVEKK